MWRKEEAFIERMKVYERRVQVLSRRGEGREWVQMETGSNSNSRSMSASRGWFFGRVASALTVSAAEGKEGTKGKEGQESGDAVTVTVTEIEDVEDIKEKPLFDYTPEGETGWDRVRNLWATFREEGRSGELSLVNNAFMSGAIFGGLIGGTLGTKTTVQDFIRRHNIYTFEGNFEARRKLQDFVTLQMLRNGFKLSWRVSLFCGLYSLVIVHSFAYRNYCNVADFAAGGALVGGLWKLKLGLRAAGAAAVTAGIMGLTAGLLIKLCIWTSGASVPEIRYWNSNYYIRRGDLYYQRHQERAKTLKELKECQDHDQLIQRKGNNKLL